MSENQTQANSVISISPTRDLEITEIVVIGNVKDKQQNTISSGSVVHLNPSEIEALGMQNIQPLADKYYAAEQTES